MSLMEDAVARYAAAADVDPHVLRRELADELTQAAMAVELAAMPDADREALDRIDTPAQLRGSSIVMPWLRGDAVRQRMRTTSVSVAEAARRLGVTDSALRRVLGTTTGESVELLGVKDSRGAWRVFAYQLPDGRRRGGEPASPAGRRAQRALPPGTHPVAVAAWWDAPNAALYLDGEELTPRAWVRRELNPDQLIDAARHEDAG